MTLKVAAASPAAGELDPADLDNATGVTIEEGAPDANAAASSTVDVPDANAPANLLDVVKSAIEPAPEPDASSSTEGDQANSEVKEPVAEAEPAAEDDANLPFHNHPRWKAVLAERDGYREPAERWGAIEAFRETNGLSTDEIAEGFEIMALLKSGDPAKLSDAREWFSERLDALNGMLGHTLPEDLQQRVDDGFLDEAGAREIAQSRATVSLRETQATRTAEATEASRAQQGAETLRRELETAAQSWEERTKAADPDYAKKADLVEAKCIAIVQREGNPPRNAAEATALVERAYGEVNKAFKDALPKPRPIAPGPTGTSTASPAASPQTLKEAIAGALAR